MMRSTGFFGFIGSFVLVAGAFLGCATATVPIDDDGGITPTTDGAVTDTASCSTMCDGGCADLKTDNANCGKCGTACPTGATCVQGSCQCGSSQSKCATACVDLKIDNANCGKCGATCGGPDAGTIMGGGTWGCVSGVCSIMCPMGKLECGGACIDPKTDNGNCGMCSNACAPMTEQCTEGMCCKTGQKVCSMACTDVLTDAKNCGMCGNACPMNMPSCSNGQCTTSYFVQVFPPTGGSATAASYWSARYYTMTFNKVTNIVAVEWMANLAVNDTIRAGIWNPQNQAKLATGAQVNGNGTLKYHRSTIAFTAQANTPYIVGVFMSNSNTTFPRKDSPSYPFTVNGVTATACWSTSTTNTDIFPTSSNSWAPDFRLELQ